MPSKIIANSIALKRLPHAILIEGKNKVAIYQDAIDCAKTILCKHDTGCGECNNCKRVNTGNYIDLLVVNKEYTSIKKEDILNMISVFSRTAADEKGIKVYIINGAETMLQHAANALLKFLEEPPENTYAILTTTNSSSLLETINSRVVKLKSNNAISGEKIAKIQSVFGADYEYIVKLNLASDFADNNEVELIKTILQLALMNDVAKFTSDFAKDKIAIKWFLTIRLNHSLKLKQYEYAAKVLDAIHKLNTNTNMYGVLVNL